MTSSKPVLFVTGGAGFIGSALVRLLNSQKKYRIVNVDKLTYAASLNSIAGISPEHVFVQEDICNTEQMSSLFEKYKPVGIVHLAAESHVDNSIASPKEFIQTNIFGTFSLLEASRKYLKQNPQFKFHHVSTDEVFGSLPQEGTFSETSRYEPNSPYSASKASSDHLVRAWQHTYGLNTVTTNCSNNFGPFQFPEKLIPVTILKAVHKLPIPIYGQGLNVRDWLYVDDHAQALINVFERGNTGETYNIGCENDVTNIVVVDKICEILRLKSEEKFDYKTLKTFVTDRPGHDFRYAINANKLKEQIGWKPLKSFDERLKETVEWYLKNLDWCYERSEDGGVITKEKNSKVECLVTNQNIF
jgi:dTDP-glucose 4,6-dehydratase